MIANQDIGLRGRSLILAIDMEQIKWIWDDEKARANFRKHQVAFSEAALVFEDPLHSSRPDPHPDGDRWQTIGRIGPFVVFVVHAFPVKWELERAVIGRIISAHYNLL
jgi:uncharacterized DUF497 family protein